MRELNGFRKRKNGVVGGLKPSNTHRSRLGSLQEGGVVGRARFRNQNRSRSHSASSTDSLGSAHSSFLEQNSPKLNIEIYMPL
ncbi:hypothetical protein JTE90_027581 [Oedothorax gibbosus]|uniref:Uncharacterized protein n=1 Tax=Oedothorax gibbosus TaxID=931172 RepID=A0AAV6VLS4_9ARAC|nr:hypothetical protein JTE90_027581 [Oedothorax gibbosus]